SPFVATSGRNYTATPGLPPRGGAFTYQWQGNNVTLNGSTIDGASVNFTASDAFPGGTPAGATIILTEVNGAGDEAISLRQGIVYPAPAVPTITVTNERSTISITNLSDSSGDIPYTNTATVLPRPRMRYLWTVPGTNSLTLSGDQAEICTFVLGNNG